MAWAFGNSVAEIETRFRKLHSRLMFYCVNVATLVFAIKLAQIRHYNLEKLHSEQLDIIATRAFVLSRLSPSYDRVARSTLYWDTKHPYVSALL